MQGAASGGPCCGITGAVPACASCGSQPPGPAGGGGRKVSGACPHHLISEEGGRRRARQEALRRERGACVTKEMLSKTQGSDLAQEIQGLPQQLGTLAPNSPKIPSADKGILSAPSSSRQLGG